MGVNYPPVRGVTWCSQFGHLQQARGLSKRRNWPHRTESHDSVASAGTYHLSHVKREERINTQVYAHSTTSDGRWCHKFPLALICGAWIQETHLSVLGCGEGAPSCLKQTLCITLSTGSAWSRGHTNWHLCSHWNISPSFLRHTESSSL